MKKSDLLERVQSVLFCAIDLEINLTRLTSADLDKIGRWATVMIYEASDNDCRARHAPRELRELLPKDHYLQTWRMPKKKIRRLYS
jgi:hypothetical protein